MRNERREIRMGNDEFILYVRKWNRDCRLSTIVLGKKTWIWIRAHDRGAVKDPEMEQACRWGSDGSFVNASNLPEKATQFRFRRDLLPELYDFLDSL